MISLIALASFMLTHPKFVAAGGGQGVKIQNAQALTICPKQVIDYGTVISVPTGCVDSTGKSIPCCLNKSGQPILAGQQLLPDSTTNDATGHIVNHFTVCAGEQVQWHTNVGTCP